MLDFIGTDLSLWGLFISSLLAATLLPGGSEAVLAGVLRLHPELFWPALLVGTLGNTMGGMITFGMGWLVPRRKGGGETDLPELASPATTQQLKQLDRARRYGPPALLLAWAPVIGDALCLAAGWLRQNPLHALLFMATGKLARYWLIAIAAITV